MAERVNVDPAMLFWALARAARNARPGEPPKPRPAWLVSGNAPTLEQLKKLADDTQTPVGYFFLREPPVEEVPIPDFRTAGNQAAGEPSPNLLDTIYLCQNQQEWYRRYAVEEGVDQNLSVGSLPFGTPIATAAAVIREALSWDDAARMRCRNVDGARRYMIDAVEQIGILVMISGIVGWNTHRKLDPDEFRGLALTDRLAPLIFVNGADSKTAQIFTLIHELCHVFSGDTALSAADPSVRQGHAQEIWANKVAADVLVPRGELIELWQRSDVETLATRFMASEVVVLTSALDAGLLEWDEYCLLCREAEARSPNVLSHQATKISPRFARAVITDTREGRTLFRDAYWLLGVAKQSAFDHLADKVLA